MILAARSLLKKAADGPSTSEPAKGGQPVVWVDQQQPVHRRRESGGYRGEFALLHG